MIPPLGDDEETKKRKLQEAADAAKAEVDQMMAAAAGAKKKKEKKSDGADQIGKYKRETTGSKQRFDVKPVCHQMVKTGAGKLPGLFSIILSFLCFLFAF